MEKVTCVAIDDDPLFLEIIKFYCKKLEYVDLMATYEDAVEGAIGLVKLKPDLIFLDIEMPYLTGDEIVNSLEVVPKVVVISSHAKFDLTSLDFEVAKYVTKPLEKPDQLDAIIREVMEVPLDASANGCT